MAKILYSYNEKQTKNINVSVQDFKMEQSK